MKSFPLSLSKLCLLKIVLTNLNSAVLWQKKLVQNRHSDGKTGEAATRKSSPPTVLTNQPTDYLFQEWRESHSLIGTVNIHMDYRRVPMHVSVEQNIPLVSENKPGIAPQGYLTSRGGSSSVLAWLQSPVLCELSTPQHTSPVTSGSPVHAGNL